MHVTWPINQDKAAHGSSTVRNLLRSDYDPSTLSRSVPFMGGTIMAATPSEWLEVVFGKDYDALCHLFYISWYLLAYPYQYIFCTHRHLTMIGLKVHFLPHVDFWANCIVQKFFLLYFLVPTKKSTCLDWPVVILSFINGTQITHTGTRVLKFLGSYALLNLSD